MDNEKSARLIRELMDEAAAVRQSTGGARFESWRNKVDAVLCQALGEDSARTDAFRRLTFDLPVKAPHEMFGGAELASFRRDVLAAEGILEASLFEIEELAMATELSSSGACDSELWAHVVHSIDAEKWDQVASQAAIFTEDRVREWAGLPAGTVGKDLWVKVLHQTQGCFVLGMTESEREGWFFLGAGLGGAVRNTDTHRIQKRSDAKMYALGVLGLCSLVLTQLRNEHGNDFVIESSVEESEALSD